MSSIPKQQFHQRLAQKNPIILDGGLATELENQGITLDSTLWSAQLLIDNPEAIYSAHKAFLDAGAEIITTASYQATLEKLYRAKSFIRPSSEHPTRFGKHCLQSQR